MGQEGGERICTWGRGVTLGTRQGTQGKCNIMEWREQLGYSVRKIETGAYICAETGLIRRKMIAEGGKYQSERKWREVFEKRQTLD
jgi:hypothetical protein